VDEGDRSATGSRIEGSPIEADLARIRFVDTSEHLDKRRLSSPVLAEQGEDFTRVEIKADGIHGESSAKGLRHGV
jgi:hypothetical protein